MATQSTNSQAPVQDDPNFRAVLLKGLSKANEDIGRRTATELPDITRFTPKQYAILDSLASALAALEDHQTISVGVVLANSAQGTRSGSPEVVDDVNPAVEVLIAENQNNAINAAHSHLETILKFLRDARANFSPIFASGSKSPRIPITCIPRGLQPETPHYSVLAELEPEMMRYSWDRIWKRVNKHLKLFLQIADDIKGPAVPEQDDESPSYHLHYLQKGQSSLRIRDYPPLDILATIKLGDRTFKRRRCQMMRNWMKSDSFYTLYKAG